MDVETMNLGDSGDSMTPLFGFGQQKEQEKQVPSTSFVYKPEVDIVPEKKAPEKNNSKSKAMDSTPISDVMMPGEDFLPAAGGGADPRFMMAPQPSYVQQAPSAQQGKQPVGQSKNPMNLTDEQMEALLAGVVAVLAFSGFAQEKLSTLVPKFLDESGKQSTIGMLVTALLVAALFYFGRRFVVKD